MVTDYYRTKSSRSGTSGVADLKLGEVILRSNMEDKLEEAYELCKGFPIGELILNSDKFYHAALSALVCKRINKLEEAKKHAEAALILSSITEPQFSHHKKVGLINTTHYQLKELEQIMDS
jgi:hypothetical protein